MMRRYAIAMLAMALAACGSAKSGPTATLDRYGAALRGGDFASAYRLMSAGFRARHSLEDFVRMMRDNPREVSETTARLGAAHRELRVTAELRYGLGDTFSMLLEEGVWRVASNPVNFYGQATPREALRSFVRAYRLKRWDIMLSFVTNRYREHMTVELMERHFEGEDAEANARMMNILEANIDQPIDDKGNEARMPYGDRYEVMFVREDGLWKLQELDSLHPE